MNVFIDGSAGTTGLQLEKRLRGRKDIRLVGIDPALRKNEEAKAAVMNTADVVFLCLPEDAARLSAALIQNPDVRVLDASVAHRTHPDWAYGFPELSPAHRTRIRESRRIAVPGCHASGFAALVYPLAQAGLVAKDTALSCFSLTGYSGGGKSLIEEYERDHPRGGRPYALGLTHKHLPEMQAVCGLLHPPVFLPVLADVYQGMLVSVPLHMDARRAHECLCAHYDGGRRVRVLPFGGDSEGILENGQLNMETLNGTDDMELLVFGHERQALLVARLDNLGKGASGAAVQCMDIAVGIE